MFVIINKMDLADRVKDRQEEPRKPFKPYKTNPCYEDEEEKRSKKTCTHYYWGRGAVHLSG